MSLIRLALLAAAVAPTAASSDHAVKIQQIIGTARIVRTGCAGVPLEPPARVTAASACLQAAGNGDTTLALASLDKLQAQLDAWRAAIAEAAAAAAAVPAAEAAVPEPPAEETAFSMNVTCARAHADWTRSLSPHRRPAARALVAAGLLPSVGGSKTQTCAARSARPQVCARQVPPQVGGGVSHARPLRRQGGGHEQGASLSLLGTRLSPPSFLFLRPELDSGTAGGPALSPSNGLSPSPLLCTSPARTPRPGLRLLLPHRVAALPLRPRLRRGARRRVERGPGLRA